MILALALLACSDKPGPDSAGPSDDTAPVSGDDTSGPPEDSGSLVDTGAVDGDGDGFAGEDDCDDADPDRHPDADEVCDDVDNDCDTLVDEDDADLVDGTTVWHDGDDDGYGDPLDVEVFCGGADHYVDNGDDCDDSSADAFPGNEVVVCGDGVDNDCSGDAGDCLLEGTVELSKAPSVNDALLSGSAEGDAAGRGLGVAGDLDGDGVDDVVVGLPGYAEGAGAAWVVPGGTEGSVEPADVGMLFEGEAGWSAGYSVDGGGDVTGDGLDDLVVGATGAESGGAVYVVPGVALAGGSLDSGIVLLADSGALGGYPVVGVGDLDGDGAADLLVGAQSADGAGSSRGVAYFVAGPVSDGSLSDHVAWSGPDDGGGTPTSLASAGDVDGDGLTDALVGYQSHDAPGTDGGVAYLVSGAAAETAGELESVAAVRYEGWNSYANFGSAVGGGDTDGDGYADVVVGSQGLGDVGEVYVFLGSASEQGNQYAVDYDAVFYGTVSSHIGTSLVVGDANSDGLADVLVGHTDGAWLVHGSFEAATPIDGGGADVTVVEDQSSDFAGAEVDLGDVSGDGYVDLLVGAPGRAGETGAAYVLSGATW